MATYEFIILGGSSLHLAMLRRKLGEMTASFELRIGVDVEVRDVRTASGRDIHSAAAAAFLGPGTPDDIDIAKALVEAGVPVIPTLPVGGSYSTDIPDFLRSVNGLQWRHNDDVATTELASVMLECTGLLRKQRRVFVSYRRAESRAAALQIYDELSARGFEVFLDTHGLRPGEPFQEVLWHRLVDSDVVVMLDTPGYFESRWTRDEIGRARAVGLQILRVVWPGHVPSRMTDLSETIYLGTSDLGGPDGPLSEGARDVVAARVESLRSQAIAARHMAIAGKLRVEVARIGGKVEAVGSHRAMLVCLEDGRQVWAYPVVGVPTAEQLNDIAAKSHRAARGSCPALIYDHVGIRPAWTEHLEWLAQHIKVVRSIRVHEAGWVLGAWED